MDTQQIFDRVAHLARLGPYPAEARQRLIKEFERILDLFNVLAELPAERSHSARRERRNVLRLDEAETFGAKQRIIGNFPQKEGNLLKIPKVIEGA